MQKLKYINKKETSSKVLKSYLKKMRSKSASAPSLNEITKIVEEVRAINKIKT